MRNRVDFQSFVLSDDAMSEEQSETFSATMSQTDSAFPVMKYTALSLKSRVKRFICCQKESKRKTKEEKWTPMRSHQIFSQFLFLFSIVLFIVYKIFWN